MLRKFHPTVPDTSLTKSLNCCIYFIGLVATNMASFFLDSAQTLLLWILFRSDRTLNKLEKHFRTEKKCLMEADMQPAASWSRGIQTRLLPTTKKPMSCKFIFQYLSAADYIQIRPEVYVNATATQQKVRPDNPRVPLVKKN